MPFPAPPVPRSRSAAATMVVGALLSALACLVVPTPPACADVIRLRTGESVKCTPLPERTDDRHLVVLDLLSGAVRTFAWEAIEPTDRDAVQEGMKIKSSYALTVKGTRIVHVLEDGSDEELFGVKESESGASVRLRRGGQVYEIPKNKISEESEELLDPREVWNPTQLMERLSEQLRTNGQDLSTTEGMIAFGIGEYAEWAGALKESLDAYRRAAADPDFLQRTTAEQRAQRVEAMLKDQAALATLRDLKTKLASNMFRPVRVGLEGFEAKHPDASEAVKKAVETFRVTFTGNRERFFRRLARFEFVKVCEKLIAAKLKEKDVKLADIRSWVRRELPEKAYAALADRMKRVDDVTPEEVRAFWEKRWEGVQKSGWTRRSFGGGTFVVYPPKITPPKQRQGAGAGGNRAGQGGGGAAPAFQIPKPLTPDQWWASAAPAERVQWVMALFATTSGLFEVSEDLEHRPCMVCQGTGLITKVLQTGDQLAYLCTRCGGAQFDKIVKFR